MKSSSTFIKCVGEGPLLPSTGHPRHYKSLYHKSSFLFLSFLFLLLVCITFFLFSLFFLKSCSNNNLYKIFYHNLCDFVETYIERK